MNRYIPTGDPKEMEEVMAPAPTEDPHPWYQRSMFIFMNVVCWMNENKEIEYRNKQSQKDQLT